MCSFVSVKNGVNEAESLEELYPDLPGHAVAYFGQLRRNLLRHRYLIGRLVGLNLKKEFRRSFLGMSWLIITPLIAVITWLLLKGAGVIEPGITGIPYPAYVLLSTSIWGFFADAYRTCGNMIGVHGQLFTVGAIPAEVILTERILIHLIRFLVPFLLSLVVLLLFGVRLSWWGLLFPLALVPLLLAGAGAGILAALLRAISVDFSQLADEGIRVLLFLTPVVYSPKITLGWLSDIVALNPLTYLVSFPRNLLTEGTFYEPGSYGIYAGLSLAFFAGAVLVFRRVQPRLIERLINN